MKNRKLAWVVTILLVVVAIAFGQFKAPVKQSDSFYLTDKADLFSAAEENNILTASKNLLQTGGARMVIVTVNHTGLRGMESYAENLWDSWKLSSIDMLLLMKDDDYYFLYGSELSYAMDQNYRTLLDRYLEPEFAVGNYDGAVLSFIGSCGAALLGSGSNWNDFEQTISLGGFSLGGIVMGIILVVVIIAVCSAFSKARPASKRRYYGGYATPSAGSFMGTMGRAAARSAMNTMGNTIRRSASQSASRPASRPVSRPASRPSSFGGGGRSRGGSFGGGGGRGGGSRGGGGRR